MMMMKYGVNLRFRKIVLIQDKSSAMTSKLSKGKNVENFRERLERVIADKNSNEIVVCGFISQAYMELAYPELKYVRFKTWTKLNVGGNQLKIRYTHHPSPKRNGVSWTI